MGRLPAGDIDLGGPCIIPGPRGGPCPFGPMGLGGPLGGPFGLIGDDG